MNKTKHRSIAREGYHFCAHPKCTTLISDGSPTVCPKHSPACQTCGGSQKIIDVWHHLEGKPPRMKKCPACRGTGLKSKQSDAFAENYVTHFESVRQSALHECAKLLEIFPSEAGLLKLHRILANNHPNGHSFLSPVSGVISEPTTIREVLNQRRGVGDWGFKDGEKYPV